jgi:raffinose/stachyose/melibiose transport system substrate-binding protein
MRVHRLAFAAAAIAALAACSPSSPGTEASGSQSAGAQSNAADAADVTISVWSWQQDQTAGWQKVIDTFEKSHPHIKVEFRGIQSTEYDTILRTGMSGEDGPDVPFLRSYGLMQSLVDGGNLVRLDDKIPALASWPAAILDGARGVKDKNVYGVPFALQTLQMFYNKKIFADNGLSVPTTWDEFVKVCDTLKGKGLVPIAGSVKDAWTLPIDLTIFGASLYGGPDFEKKLLSGQAKFTDPAYVAAIAHLKDVAGKYFPKDAGGVGYSDTQTLFSSGRAAMHPGGSWEIGDFNKTGGVDFGVFSVPAPPDSVTSKTLTPGYVDGALGLNAKSKHQEQALEFLKWTTTKEFGDAFMQDLAQPSVVPDATATDPVLNDALKNYRANPTPYLEYADFGYGSPDGWTLATQNLQSVLLNKSTPEQAAAAIDKGVSQWFKPSAQ